MRESTIVVPGSSGMQATLHHADQPRALLLLVHGFGEHSRRHRRTVRFLLDRGVSVVTYDLRGHGSAPGPRVTVAVEEHISDNLAVRDAVLAWSRATDDGELGSLPRLLMGHSLGGLIAAESALRRPWDLSGLVLSSPGFVVGEDSPAPLRAMAPLVARLLPRLPVEKLEPDDMSRVPEYVADYEADPLVHHGGVPARSAGTMLAGGRRFLSRCGALRTPTLLLGGSADTVTAPRGFRRFATEAGSEHDPRPEITYREFEGGRHEVLNDLCADEAYSALGEWLDARLA